jgi:hypothetical protein
MTRVKALPLNNRVLGTAYKYLIDTLALSPDWVDAPSFAIRRYEYFKNDDPPDPSLLNSFFLNDLQTVKELYKNDKLTANLESYLGLATPFDRIDILNNQEALEEAIAPGKIPPARWPAPRFHSLVLLQQAAVNLSLSECINAEIIAVNGPPGTGKTTLLRDIVASLISQRAEAMCKFDNPATAFETTGQKLQAGQAWLHFYSLSDKLKGYEIVIASSNNKAVENVSAELPGINAISPEATDLRYFAPLATALLEKESWGLIAAVLGNAVNRSKFRQVFWWDDDLGLSAYLAEASGTPQLIEIKDPETGEIVERRPRIVVECNAPASQTEALINWSKARGEFQIALTKSKNALSDLAKIRVAVAALIPLANKKLMAQKELRNAELLKEDLETSFISLENDRLAKETAFNIACERQNNQQALKPGFFKRIFQRRLFINWKSEWEHLSETTKSCYRDKEHAAEAAITASHELQKATSKLKTKNSDYVAAAKAYLEKQDFVTKAKEEISNHLIDKDFFLKSHADKHYTIPWCDEACNHLRNNVFNAAVKLHKAFIDAAARPLRHNLGLLMLLFAGKSFPDAQKDALIGNLWSSFFLVVPSISTTFASVERMFSKLPSESLGWLLVDEAGQALPQAALGAIMRTKRAVFVGDPMQIEPVVSLPETLTQSICRHYGVDPDHYNAPQASAQTIADAVTKYYAEFESKQGSRTVGLPLLVHRRCSNPMFSISNVVAYGNLMVQAKKPQRSKIKDCLGPSAWIDVRGEAQEKWCPQEGVVVLDLLQKLKQNEVAPNLYIVTPFVSVQDNMRHLIDQSGILLGWVEDPYHWVTERIGTVHTVQGRETEAVIFILGAPAHGQTGARGWAGGTPNLLNVAVSRAKEAIYVVGNRDLWRSAGVFKDLAARIN